MNEGTQKTKTLKNENNAILLFFENFHDDVIPTGNGQNRILVDQFNLGLSFRFLSTFIYWLIDDVLSMIHTFCNHKSSLQEGI